MNTDRTSYDHGWNACRACHSGRAQTRHERWQLTANPGYLGDPNPDVLVLGFSKGATQVGAIEKEPFDQVAFKRHRVMLEKILRRLGVPFHGQSIDHTMTASSRGLGYASLIRCSISHEKGGEQVSSGTIMPDALAAPWARSVMSRCVAQHLVPMPASVRRVVLLGNGDHYVAGVRQLLRDHYPDYADINPMGFSAGGRIWVFAIHPAAQGSHGPTWLHADGSVGLGHKRELAIAAFGTLGPSPTLPAVLPKRRLVKATLA